MKDEQVDQLLEELRATRESFDRATSSIKWNRFNTIVQYVLIAFVMVIIGSGVIYYLHERKVACERGNDLRITVQGSLDNNAAAIGAALVIVTGASQERFQEYMDAYNQQEKPDILELREC